MGLEPGHNAGALYAELETIGERAIDEVREEAEAADVESVEAVLGSGTPASAITNYIDDQDIDLGDGASFSFLEPVRTAGVDPYSQRSVTIVHEE